MKKIVLSKANGLSGEPLEDVVIEIGKRLPKFTGRSSLNFKELYIEEAKKLTEGLLESLPQGMVDQLVIELLKRKASLHTGVMKNG